MPVALAITIDPCGEAIGTPPLDDLVPASRLRLCAPVVFTCEAGRWLGRLELDGHDADCRNDVALYLVALRKLSARFPRAAIAIAAQPDGGELRLSAGSFGADEEELALLMASVGAPDLAAGGAHERLYVSFRIEADAHAQIIELVTRGLPPGWSPPVVDSASSRLALGFEIGGDTERLATLVAVLRLAWRQEGSGVECLVEIEGDDPRVVTLRTWSDWIALERGLRAFDDRTRPVSPPRARDASRPVVLERVPGAGKLLAGRRLSWIDADDQIVCLAGDELLALPERVEAGRRGHGALCRRSDDSMYFEDEDTIVEVPPPAPGTERRVLGVGSCGEYCGSGVVLADTIGDLDRAETQLRRVSRRGISDGPRLAQVRGLDVCWEGREVYLLAETSSGTRLHLVDLGTDTGPAWGYVAARPWRDDEAATDVAAMGNARIAITCESAGRSMLYLVERGSLVHARRIALPCVAPQIVGRCGDLLWITGMVPPRCELLCVELSTGIVTIVTAGLPDAKTIDVAVPERWDADPHGCLFATPHAVYATITRVRALGAGFDSGPNLSLLSIGVEHVAVLGAGGAVTAMLHDDPTTVFLRDPKGARLVLGCGSLVAPLTSAGFAPRWLHDTDWLW